MQVNPYFHASGTVSCLNSLNFPNNFFYFFILDIRQKKLYIYKFAINLTVNFKSPTIYFFSNI